MRHRRCGLSTYGLNGVGKGDEHPPTLQEGHGTLYVYLPLPSLILLNFKVRAFQRSVHVGSRVETLHPQLRFAP